LYEANIGLLFTTNMATLRNFLLYVQQLGIGKL